MRPFVTSTSRTAGHGCDGGCGAGCANAAMESPAASATETVNTSVLVDTRSSPLIVAGTLPARRVCALPKVGRSAGGQGAIAHRAADRQRLRHGLALGAQSRGPVAQVAFRVADGEHFAVGPKMNHR